MLRLGVCLNEFDPVLSPIKCLTGPIFTGSHGKALSLQSWTIEKTDRAGRDLEILQIQSSATLTTICRVVIIVNSTQIIQTFAEQLPTQCQARVITNFLQHFSFNILFPVNVTQFIWIFLKPFISSIQLFFKSSSTPTTATAVTTTSTTAPTALSEPAAYQWKYCLRESHQTATDFKLN